ncbi:MAG: hypothetical protein JRN66_06600 [Nitrososphaerota archaeon]|nr:hypothetical protein [Nitrososphaerota archaeon]
MPNACKCHYYTDHEQGKLSPSEFTSAALWAEPPKRATYKAESAGRRITLLGQCAMAWPSHNQPGQTSRVLASSMNRCPYPEIRTDGGLALLIRMSSIAESPAFERRSSFAGRGPLLSPISRGSGR